MKTLRLHEGNERFLLRKVGQRASHQRVHSATDSSCSPSLRAWRRYWI